MTTETTNYLDKIIANSLGGMSDECVLELKILDHFFKQLVELGCQLVQVFDGEDVIKIKDNDIYTVLNHVFSVDESEVRFIAHSGENISLYILLGNGETYPIYDHTVMSEELEQQIFGNFGEIVKLYSPEMYELHWA
ncbi:hypothetical protein [Acinetobacter sp. P1(2025)]|uniref:hypothetical protein n=1 Tax=Acinetobacter sp. P1(2025) TaxID=3446120 RepID=UPI003F52C685